MTANAATRATHFAPTIRLESVDDTPAPDIADVIKADLTLVNTGISGLSLTLNNQRFGGESESGIPLPIWPPWKYNDLTRLRFGQRLVFGLGYPDAPDSEVTATVRVTDIKFSFPNDGAAHLTVECKDLLSLLETHPTEDKNYRNRDELFIVNDALSRSGCGLTLADSERRLSLSEPLNRLSHAKSQTYYKLVEDLATRLDYELYFDDDDGQVHFALSRSLTDESIDELVVLQWGRDLLSFAPTLMVWDQYTSAYPSGRRARERQRVRPDDIKEEAILDDLEQERDEPGLLTAIDVRRTLIDDQPECPTDRDAPSCNPHPVQVTNLDDERAAQATKAALRTQARKLLTVQVETIGRPELRPGAHVVIAGMSRPFDGVYYITRAVHAYGGSGYRTTLSLRRPAIFDPRPTNQPSETE